MIDQGAITDAEKIKYLKRLLADLDDSLPDRLRELVQALQLQLVGLREQQKISQDRLSAIRERKAKINASIAEELEGLEKDVRRNEAELDRTLDQIDYIQKQVYKLTDVAQLALYRKDVREVLLRMDGDSDPPAQGD